MRSLFRVLVALAALTVMSAMLAACGGGDRDRTGVVVTTDILGDITRAVVGDATTVTVLMRPGTDPHSFAVSAREAAAVDEAALVVHNGLGLEEGVARHVRAAADAGIATLAVGERADPMPYRAGDTAGQPDPHFWTDPRRVRLATEAITDAVLTHVEGIDAVGVRERADRYLEQLDLLDREMTERFAALPAHRRALVTNHHVFGYLAQRFDFRVLGAVVPSGTTLASPSASDLESLAGAIREAGVDAVFVDSAQPDRLARVLAERVGLHVRVVSLYTESLTPPDGAAPTYLAMMRANTDALADALATP